MPRMLSKDKRISKGRQSVTYTEIMHYGDHRLRLVIKRDFYDFQSFARVQRWNGTKWEFVDNIAYANMKSQASTYANVTNDNFKADRDELLRRTKLVL